MYNPLDALATQYLSAVDEDRYNENFKKHEERFNLSYEEQDLESMFSEAEKIMNEEDGNATPPTEDRDLPDN